VLSENWATTKIRSCRASGLVQHADEADEGRSTLGRSSTSRGRAAHEMNGGRRAAPAVLLSTITYGLRRLSARRSTDEMRVAMRKYIMVLLCLSCATCSQRQVTRDPDVSVQQPKVVAAPIPPSQASQTTSTIRTAEDRGHSPDVRALPKEPRAVPKYPPEMRVGCIEADVDVLVFIDASGKVTGVDLLRKSAHPEFNESARQAAHSQQWAPAIRDGDAVSSAVKYSYRFRLASDTANLPEGCTLPSRE
jgi:TonB family protein